MAYTTTVTGTTITSSWANADVRDQVIVPFSSTAARSAAITSPVTGQVSTLTTNLSTEGIYQYNSAGQWRLPWALPWGVVSTTSTTSASSTTSGTTELAVATAPSFTAVANRYYRVTWSCSAIGTVASDLFDAKIRLTNVAGTNFHDQRYVVTGGSLQIPLTVVASISTISAGATVLVGTFQRAAGTGTLQTVAGLINEITVEDCGPSGAPA